MLHSRLESKHILLAPQAMTNSATATANVDVSDGNAAVIIVALAAEINTNAIGPTLSLLESDDTVVTNFATVTADRTAEDITTAKPVVYDVDLRGRKKYLRLSVTTETTTNDDVTLSATVTKGRRYEGGSGSDAVVVNV